MPERFGELAGSIASKLGARVLITAGPNDGETVKVVVGHAVPNVTVLNNLPLRQIAAIISHCSVFVSNDAAPMHIAAAVGTPTIGLFGSGEDHIWFPYSQGEGHLALRKDVPCHPCHLDYCTRHGDGYMECMKLLSVQEVFAAVERALHLSRGNVSH
jgi:ADP-heptose:LPS heptosyltransferase